MSKRKYKKQYKKTTDKHGITGHNADSTICQNLAAKEQDNNTNRTGLTISIPRPRIAVARVKGRYRKDRNDTVQDVVRKYRGKLKFETDVSGYSLVVLCDGAGSKRKSRMGAEACVEQMDLFVRTQKWSVISDADDKRALVQNIVESIQSKILSLGGAINEYACTLIFILCIEKSKTYVCGHIGDGIALQKNNSEFHVLSKPENGEHVNETFFITDSTAYEHLRIETGSYESIEGFIICSDGVSDSLCRISNNDVQISPVCNQMLGWLSGTEDEIVIQEALRNNLSKHFSKNSYDDMSIGLIYFPSNGENNI